MSQPDIAPERQRVLTLAILRAAAFLDLKRGELAAALGLSPATLSRMFGGSYLLDEKSKHWELATLLLRLYRGLDAIVAGDEGSLRAWMRAPNSDLRAVPAQLITRVDGLVTAVAYVDSQRARL